MAPSHPQAQALLVISDAYERLKDAHDPRETLPETVDALRQVPKDCVPPEWRETFCWLICCVQSYTLTGTDGRRRRVDVSDSLLARLLEAFADVSCVFG